MDLDAKTTATVLWGVCDGILELTLGTDGAGMDPARLLAILAALESLLELGYAPCS